MKLKRFFWGFFFLLAGLAIIAGKLGYLGSINIVTLILTIFLIPIVITSIMHRNFAGILFPLAVIGIFYAKPLGITELTPWPLLLTALFLSIGLSIIFHGPKYSKYFHVVHGENFDTIIDEEDESCVKVDVHMGSSIKYVNAKDFKKGIFHASCGALKVYFDGATVSEEGAEIIVDASLSGVEFYIPREWNVKNEVQATLGGVEEKNKAEGKGPVVTLKGTVSLSGIEIIYI